MRLYGKAGQARNIPDYLSAIEEMLESQPGNKGIHYYVIHMHPPTASSFLRDFLRDLCFHEKAVHKAPRRVRLLHINEDSSVENEDSSIEK